MREAFSWVSPRTPVGRSSGAARRLGDSARLSPARRRDMGSLELFRTTEYGSSTPFAMVSFHTLPETGMDTEILVVSERPGSAASCLGR